MLDTDFEQQKQLHSSNRTKGIRKEIDSAVLPHWLVELYQHQSILFDNYRPRLSGTFPITVVMAEQSPFAHRQYIKYLDSICPASTIEYLAVDGDHFTMLTGQNAEIIANILKVKGSRYVA